MINKVIIVGRLGADGELAVFSNNSSKLNLRVATSDSYKNKEGQWVDNTDWHQVEVWNPSEHIRANVFKGALLYIEGKNKTSTYEDAQGATKYRHFIKAETVRLLSSSGGSQDGGGGHNYQNPPAYDGTFPEGGAGNDDLPF